MRVLWLVNVMPKAFAVAIGRTGTNTQGWVAGLCAAVRAERPDVSLMIACVGPAGARAEVNGISYCSLGESGDLTVRVAACIKTMKPDIVHLHGTEGVFAALPRSAFCGCPVCASLQGIMSGYYQHFFGNVSAVELWPHLGILRRLGLGTSISREAELWRTKFAPREENVFKNVDHFLGRTTWDRAWTNYLNPMAIYHEVGEVLRERFYRGRLVDGELVAHRIYCSASMQYPLKGGHWLLRAIAALKVKYPDVKLVVANAQGVQRPASLKGRLKWKQYHRYLNMLITELGLWENVELKPSLSADDVADELTKAEVFCLPSLVENSPNSLGEAMLMKTPVVATDVGGVSSMIKSKEEGLFVPSGDPAVLAAALDETFSNRAAAIDRAARAYAHARVTHNPSRIVKQLMTAYEAMRI